MTTTVPAVAPAPSAPAAPAAPAAPDLDGLRLDERVVARYADLPPQERKGADVLLEHFGDLATYSAAELATLAGVSKATMSRLFRSLGFDDFTQVRDHLRRLRGHGLPVTLGATPDLDAHADAESAAVRVAAASLAVHVDAVADLLAHAPRVVVVGLRNSYPVALHLRQQLTQVRPHVTLLPQPGQSWSEDVVDLSGQDAVVLVAFRRRPPGVRALAERLHAAGTPVVLLADPTARALAAHATWWLECPVQARGAFDSYAAASSVVAALADAVLARRGRTGEQRVAAIDSAYRTLGEVEAR
ncbi:MurR/RpiR family transcriptional regulator [Cellulomonas wangsupingiae]|uniref:MurR/RpiR family transcriptional regulator n=1 Tax=Cellulomonas wangsupingiae TaxID=2968085 RepID=A0ABY5K245_9CELL|nr:MurR/RpiR family transcriptional regulator [Cellulomonas wangsupingiae]MCC2335510.1 MurR/RpiR family transcriptional regulator [Cellulomonas wangsupingiae]UUI64319.1 MurR/RpiR family transcriptional regulator [Cellulomonas wangsupingiae]